MFPARLGLDFLRQPRCALQAMGLQPATDLFRTLAKCRPLQRLQRGQLATHIMVLALQLGQVAFLVFQAGAQVADATDGRIQLDFYPGHQVFACVQVLHQLFDIRYQGVAAELLLFLAHAIEALVQLLHVAFEVIESSALDLCGLVALGHALVEGIPVRLPGMHGLFSLGQGQIGLFQP